MAPRCLLGHTSDLAMFGQFPLNRLLSTVNVALHESNFDNELNLFIYRTLLMYTL